MSCKDKRTYFSQEEAAFNALDHQKTYACPHCGHWHVTSDSHKKANKKRYFEWRKKRLRNAR